MNEWHSELYDSVMPESGPPIPKPCSTSIILNSEASPKAISERTSYLQVRFGISPLPTPSPRTFQRTWVRSSSAFYRTFNLDMGRSHGFGSTTTYSNALFRLAFAAAPSLNLTSHAIVTRRFILQKARHHPLTGFDLL